MESGIIEGYRDSVVILNEFLYDIGDKFDDLGLNPEYVDSLRLTHQGNCLTVAEDVSTALMKVNTLASILTFKGVGNAFLNGLVVNNELTGKTVIYSHHSVVMLGGCIADVLHSDRLIPTKEYIDKLLELNKDGIELIKPLSLWYDDEGYPFVPSIDYLREYKSA